MASKKFPQCYAAIVAAGGALAMGAMLGWTSPVQAPIVDEKGLGFAVSDEDFSWVGSAPTLGAAFTCIPVGILLPILGRKIVMILSILVILAGWACLLFASNVVMLIVGRALLGAASGGFCVAAPIYIGEISEETIRGALGSLFQLSITIGILYVYTVGHFFDLFNISLACAIIPVIVCILLLCIPESPTHYISKGDKDKAAASFSWLRGKDYNSAGDIAAIAADVEKFKANPVSIGTALSRPVARKALMISMGLMFFQQLSGINAVIFYTVDIFKSTGANIDPSAQTIAIGVIQVIATFISTMVVDKAGRRILLMASTLVMAISTFLLGVYFVMKENDPESVKTMGWLPIGSISLFIIMFSFGIGPVPWLIMGEIFPSDIKAIAGSLTGTTNWCLAFVVSKTFVNLKDILGIGPTFWLFSGITVIGFLFVLIKVPETKNKSLAEIQAELEG